MTNATDRVACWRLCLSKYESDKVDRAGVKYEAVDALSRMTTNREDKSQSEDECPITVIDTTSVNEDIVRLPRAGNQPSVSVDEGNNAD